MKAMHLTHNSTWLMIHTRKRSGTGPTAWTAPQGTGMKTVSFQPPIWF